MRANNRLIVPSTGPLLMVVLLTAAALGCGLEESSPSPRQEGSCQRPAVALQPLAPQPATHQGIHFGEATTTSPTRDKPQNKLWFNDGSWWAVMLSAEHNAVHIFELMDDHSWRRTDAVVDPRLDTTADVRWDGEKLYVASRHPTAPLRVLRFTYHPDDRAYELDSGFPVNVNAVGTSSANIEIDSTGRLWVAYVSGRQLWIAHSGLDQLTWAPPFVPEIDGTDTTAEDVAALVSLNDGLGLMWSNQRTHTFYFAIHRDEDPPERWVVEPALAGEGMVDNHIDLKSWGERIYAVVKTSLDDAPEPDLNAPLVLVLSRSEDGSWSRTVFGTVAELHTRPIALIDASREVLHVFASRRREVVFKTAPLADPDFQPGPGLPFVRYDGAHLIDPTSSDHAVDAESGIVVLASSMDDRYYYHAELPLAEPARRGETPTQAVASISFLSASSAATSDGLLTLALPQGVEPGDVLLASVNAPDGSAAEPSAGWTLVRADTDGRTTKTTYFRVAAQDEQPSHAWQVSGDGVASAVILAYTGVDGVDPIEDSGGSAVGPQEALSAPSVRVTTSGGHLVALFVANAESPLAAPASMVELTSSVISEGEWNVVTQTAEAVCAPGPTAEVAPRSSADSGGVAHALVLRPAPPRTALPSPGATAPAGTPPTASGPSPFATPTTHAGIEFKAASSAASAQENLLIIDLPADTAAGDLLLASIDTRGTAELTAPLGWTKIRSDTTDRAISKTTYYRIAGVAEPRWYTWYLSRHATALGTILAYSGVDPEAPIDVTGGRASDVVSPMVDLPSVRSTEARSRLVAFFAIAVATRLSSPADLEARVRVETPASDQSAYSIAALVADATLSEPGRTAELVATAELSGKGVAQAVVLRAADY